VLSEQTQPLRSETYFSYEKDGSVFCESVSAGSQRHVDAAEGRGRIS